MNGYIEIYDKCDALKYSVLVTEKCIYSKTLMEEEYVLISFVSDVLLDFAKGDYINTQYGRFTLTDVERPAFSGEGGYQYEQKFHAPWQRWKERFAFYNRQVGSEKAWKMTQKPEYFMDIIVSNIRDAGFGEYLYDIDGTLNEMKLVEFDATSICDALTKVAEAWDTEWWIEGNVIHLSKCEFGSPVKLETNVEVTDMNRSEGQENKRYTRLYAFGSSRNLPKNYRKETSGVVIDGVVEARLKLPEGTPYVDAWENMSEDDIIEGIEIFENVYPRRIGTISDITTKEYTDEIDDEEGKRFENWNAYRYKDAALTFFKDYILDGVELHIIFQTGKLAGMDFVVNFNPEGEMERLGGSINSNAQLFEIVRNENYGIPLPSDNFHPDEGDTYILYGYDSTKLGEMGFISSAENELLQEAIKAMEKAAKDKSVFSCPTNPIRCAGYTEAGGRLTHNNSDEIDLDVGQIVKLVDPRYFDGEGRLSRVRSFEKRLDNNYSATYECGETRAYSRSEVIKEQIQELTFQSRQYVSTGGSSVYLIKRYDTTTPTDSNAFSAKRAQYEFLSRIADDIAQGHITFDDGLTALASAFFKNGAEFGDFIKSLYAGKGAGIDSNGNAEFESVRVRSYFEALELIINRLSAIEGDQLLTEADTIESVDDLGDNCYGLHLRSKWEGYFTAQVENNVLKGIINTLAQNAHINANQGTSLNQNGTDTSANYYTSWMRVNSVNAASNYIEVTLYPDDEVPSGQNFPPCEMMKIARWGNQTDKRRQKCLYLSSTEGRIVKLTGVTKPIIDDWKSYGATFGELPEFLYDYFYNRGTPIDADDDYIYARGLIVQDLIYVDRQGRPVVNIVDRGQYDPAANYYCEAINPDTGVYETSDVWFMGCKWRCCKNLPTSAPAWNNTDWAMIEGNPEFTVDFADTDLVFDPNNFDVTLTIIAKLYNIDITTDILDSDVEWTRYSEDADGVPRIASDNIWAINRANSGKSIHLTTADCDFLGYIPKVLRFTATVTLRDGMTPVTQAQAIFERSTP